VQECPQLDLLSVQPVQLAFSGTDLKAERD